MQESLAGIYYIITIYSTIYQLYTIVLLYQLNITMPYGMLYWAAGAVTARSLRSLTPQLEVIYNSLVTGI